MIINTEIVDAYIAGTSFDYNGHWIFHSIIAGQCVFEEPTKKNTEKIKFLYRMIFDDIRHFEPFNQCVWESFFGRLPIPDTTAIYLIVGSPASYDAMVRDDPKGNNCIILDLNRLASYSEDKKKLSDLVTGILTHEIAHICINNRYPHPRSDASLVDILKDIVFDEGIAHFLSFQKDVLSTDWHTNEMNMRRKNAYQTLRNVLHTDRDMDREQIIIDANSGAYWDKFAAISGLFAIGDYYEHAGNDIKAFEDLYHRGPDNLFNFILNEKYGG